MIYAARSGIIDPPKVVRVALRDAASVAGPLITTDAMIADKPEKKAPPMPDGDMGGRGMGRADFCNPVRLQIRIV